MEIWFGAVMVLMAVVILVLFLKVHMMQRAAEEIAHDFAERLLSDTNTLIDCSCGDRYMRGLANTLNIQLRELRSQRHRFCQGDLEKRANVEEICS